MDYIFSARSIRKGKFGNEPAATHFLEVPSNGKDLSPSQKISQSEWRKKVQAEALHNPGDTDDCPGDIVIYVHGFNNSTKTVLDRHRKIAKGLKKNGFKGVVVSYDWPSADSALNYLEDRMDAKMSAFRLVADGIRPFARLQSPSCKTNTHILAHSMGCYVVREAFDDADDRPAIAAASWSVSQILFVGADVSASGMKDGSSKSSSLYRHCVRLTNYYNHFDDVLTLSNVKRVGVSPRAGRVGLPANKPSKAVDLHCGHYYDQVKDGFTSASAHNWYFDDPIFMTDAFHTIDGRIDREDIPTRRRASNIDDLVLVDPSKL